MDAATVMRVAGAACVIPTWVAAVRAFGQLSPLADVPMQFGVTGAVNWSAQGRGWVFFYALFGTFCAGGVEGASWLRSNAGGRDGAVRNMTAELLQLLLGSTSVLMLVIAVQLRAICETPVIGLRPKWVPLAALALYGAAIARYQWQVYNIPSPREHSR
eukprot:TRINITY_DN31067_c0_g1_i1.p1 TRINITY_DN31067_c0_g1~~TRINITY_DN31067_c0_g1_i1.p1  ORF type:complete len:174 (+),score=32.39 TRINITY_DN31067_c0_g1_i1:47-523(+)